MFKSLVNSVVQVFGPIRPPGQLTCQCEEEEQTGSMTVHDPTSNYLPTVIPGVSVKVGCPNDRTSL